MYVVRFFKGVYKCLAGFYWFLKGFSCQKAGQTLETVGVISAKFWQDS